VVADVIYGKQLAFQLSIQIELERRTNEGNWLCGVVW